MNYVKVKISEITAGPMDIPSAKAIDAFLYSTLMRQVKAKVNPIIKDLVNPKVFKLNVLSEPKSKRANITLRNKEMMVYLVPVVTYVVPSTMDAAAKKDYKALLQLERFFLPNVKGNKFEVYKTNVNGKVTISLIKILKSGNGVPGVKGMK